MMLSGVKFLLDFLWFTLHCTVRWEFSLVDMSGYNHPVQFTPDKYVRRIWQLRRTIGKYVVNVRRGRRISYTLMDLHGSSF